MRSQFRFSDWLSLTVEGDAAAIRHFEREYGAVTARESDGAALAGGGQTIRITFGPLTGEPGELRESGDVVSGAHKRSRWRLRLSAPEAASLGATIALGGLSRGFARMLVQGYFIEPLLSVAAARAGGLLLPAAGFDDAGAVVVIGSSGSGKTSLAMHALACGSILLGDDQILVDPDGRVRPFPRRLRLYSDLNERAPLAFERLPRRLATGLRIRGVIRGLSAGRVAPPLLVEPAVLGRTASTTATPIRRVVILERPKAPGRMRTEAATLAEAVEIGQKLLREQRSHLAEASSGWREAVGAIERLERPLLEEAFRRASVERVVAPFPLSGDDMNSLLAVVLGANQELGPRSEG